MVSFKQFLEARRSGKPFTPDHRLPFVHKIIPDYIMQRIPYRGEAEVTIYRAVNAEDPIQEILPGHWVTLDKNYAQTHGSHLERPFKIISKQVPAEHVSWAGTDENEWFYSPNE